MIMAGDRYYAAPCSRFANITAAKDRCRDANAAEKYGGHNARHQQCKQVICAAQGMVKGRCDIGRGMVSIVR